MTYTCEGCYFEDWEGEADDCQECSGPNGHDLVCN